MLKLSKISLKRREFYELDLVGSYYSCGHSSSLVVVVRNEAKIREKAFNPFDERGLMNGHDNFHNTQARGIDRYYN